MFSEQPSLVCLTSDRAVLNAIDTVTFFHIEAPPGPWSVPYSASLRATRHVRILTVIITIVPAVMISASASSVPTRSCLIVICTSHTRCHWFEGLARMHLSSQLFGTSAEVRDPAIVVLGPHDSFFDNSLFELLQPQDMDHLCDYLP